MTPDQPVQRPEGKLIQDTLSADGRSIRQVSALAGISDARWRQIVRGAINTPGGRLNAVVAPAQTLAKMALVLGISAEQLASVDRGDAALVLDRLRSEYRAQSAKPRTERVDQPDEIDLIYSSRSMTAQQKLEAIRKVLHLRAEMEEQQARDRKEAGARRVDTPSAR